ncbi:MAG: hypothetical protein ACYCOR_17940 [Acidobacteriaceae bacterium]
MTTTQIDFTDDVLDIRDIIARFEYVEDALDNEEADADDKAEALLLRDALKDLEGTGGDEQWRGDWYPVTLIADRYFKKYAMELADEIGAIPDGVVWPLTCIDWDQAARELQMDYTSVEIDGHTFWVR